MKIQSLIICDDVRQEVGNKFTLVGIYDHSIEIGVPSGIEIPWPIGMNLGFMVRGVLADDEAHCNAIDVQFIHGDTVIARLSASVKVQDVKKPFSIQAKLPNFPIIGPGTLKFKLTLKEGTKVIRDVSSDYGIEILVQQKSQPSHRTPSPTP